MSGRSALVVTVPIPASLEAIRRRSVPEARLGIPPHLTIVYPFKAADALGREVRTALAAITGAEQSFRVRFHGTGRFPGYVWAAPDVAHRFHRLTARVVERFPDDHQFDRGFTLDEWRPHLTLAAGAEDELDAIEQAALATGAFPFDATVSALDVLTETGAGRWRRRWRLPFRP